MNQLQDLSNGYIIFFSSKQKKEILVRELINYSYVVGINGYYRETRRLYSQIKSFSFNLDRYILSAKSVDKLSKPWRNRLSSKITSSNPASIGKPTKKVSSLLPIESQSIPLHQRRRRSHEPESFTECSHSGIIMILIN